MPGKKQRENSVAIHMRPLSDSPDANPTKSLSPVRRESSRFRIPQEIRDGLAVMLTLVLIFETLPLSACSSSGSGRGEPAVTSPSPSAPSHAGNLSAGGENEPEQVILEFLPNAPEGVAVRGGTPSMTVKMDNEDSSLPECGYAADGYEFCGWSTAANGESDPVTGMPAISVPDRQSLTNLDYDLEQVTNREGQEVVTSDPASLAEYIQDGRVYLYAQWKKTETPQAPQTPTDTVPDSGDEKGTGGEASPVATKVARHAGLEAVTVEGNVEPSEASIAESLEQQGIQADDATRIAIKAVRPASLVKNAQPPEATAIDTLDGTSIGPVRMAWVTQDTVDNGNESILYLKPDNDLPQAVVMRMNYSFSGEHDYEPGDINITIPTSMFHKRGGAETGELTIPFPENPKASDDFNWVQQGDTYVLTNTRKMSAATAGYIEFQIGNLRPHEIVDMSTSDEFWAHVEVTTWAGNPLSKTSNKIAAQIDTEEVVRSANKYSTGVQYVSPSEIDSPLVNPSEEAYVLVSWYMYSYVVGNTDFTLSSVDAKTDTYQGFIVSPTPGGDGQSYTNPNHFTGYTSGSTDGTAGTNLGYQTVTVAYPFSQFRPDTQYTFENRIDYTLTETDPATTNPVDERKVTYATATASHPWSWHEPKFDAPTGHFMVNKIGNDGSAGANPSPYWAHPYTSYMWDQLDTNVHNRDDYYGIYPSALNQIQDGNDVEVAYTVESIGYLLPWTLKDGGNSAKISDYGQRSVRMDTYDTDDTKNSPIWLDGNIPLSRGVDYRYTAVEFPKKPSIGLPRAINLGADGQIALRYAGDGTVEYAPDPTDAHIPVIHLKAKVGGVWQELATADWRTGSLVLTASSAGSVIGNRVLLPANTEQVMTSVDSTNAYVYYYIRPVISIKAGGALGNMVPSLFSPGGSPNYTPSIGLYNSTYMKAYDSHGAELVDIHKTAMDSLRGYSTDVAVNPAKQGTQTIADVDYDRRLVTVHYSAQVQEQSYIPDVATYQQAIAEGRITPETEGVWYDLLPKGMNPVLSTIRLRSLDNIRNAYAIRNYKDSGRTLLVVEANLIPSPKEYTDAGVKRYMDAPEISFDATYGFEAIKDYGGDNIHNVIAFESLSRDPLGTVPNHGGEPDDPRSNNNVRTAESFANDTERNAMTGIDPAHPGNRFVYAGVTQNLTALSAARTSLAKDIDVYNDNKGWTKGTYDDIRKAYEGGPYSYRLRMMSDADTISKDLVIYDSLENFHAGQGNDPADVNAPRWQGTFTGVDVSQLIAKGVAPVVYYSTIPNLTLAADTTTNNMMNVDLRDSSVWIDETTFRNNGGNLAAVKAIAIDCSKDANGNDFKLQPTESISAVVSMRAPSEEQAGTAELIAQDAHAYNNVFLGCTSVDARTGTTARTGFIRFDYTKVGLKEHRLGVTKEWDDGDNRDGLRPTSLTVRLYANGQATNKILSLDDANSWQGTFEHMAYADAGGQPIRYTVVEEPVPAGYAGGVTQDDAGFVIHNKHIPETIDISGHKTWIGGENEIPTQIYLSLLANGTEVRRVRVTPDSEGNWNYSFTNLYKYENGQPIDYQFQEETELSRRWVCAHDGANIVNTYHPYGDLKVQKTALNQTPVSATAKFKFFFEFRDETDELIPDKFPCTLPGGATIQVGNGDFVELRSGESAIVREIPDGIKYRVTEEQRDGYSITQSSGLSGEIFGNSMQEASVTNKYAAKGSVNLTARKHLTGRDMQNYQFRAELRNDLGAVIRVATNKVDSTDPAYGTFQFGTMRYTEQDIGTHEYVMAETVRGLGGYTYDTTVYKVIVMVTDNGDGTLNTVVTYKTADGTQVVEQPQFNNQYHATGSIQLKAWKQLKGRQLQDQEFEFELRDENGQRVGNVVRNNADGEIVFDAIHFDESHVGKTYRYVAHEVNGSDDTVVYSTDAYGYQVTVMDNGDGTLSFSSDMVDIVDGELTSTIIDIVPVFTNTLVPGSLRVEKHVDDVPEGHEDDQFRFKIRLSGEDIEDGQYEYTHEQLVPSEPTYTNGYAYAVLDDEGTLTFFRSEDTYQTGPDQPALDVAGNSYAGHIYANIENQTGTSSSSAPWYSQRSSIKKVTIAPNQVISPVNCAGWFYQCSNLSDTSGLSSLDTSQVTNMSLMFCGCSGAAFTAPDVSNWNTSNVKAMGGMFSGCSGAGFTAPDVSQWDTSNVTNMSSMFSGCSDDAFTVPDVSEWDTSKVTNMNFMFSGCSGAGFTAPDVSNWDTSNVTNMSNMFYNCSGAGFTAPDVSNWDTSSVTNMSYMFHGCSGADFTAPDVSKWDTSNVTNMSGMFGDCSGDAFTAPDVSKWDTSNVTSMRYMFSDCHGAAFTAPDVSKWDTSSVEDMESMFAYCSGVAFTAPDVSKWNTSNITNMNGMFRYCSGDAFTAPDVSKWDTSNVTNMGDMFCGCHGAAFTAPDVSDWNTSNVKAMGGMFWNCSGDAFTAPDVSKWNTSNVTNMSYMFENCRGTGFTSIDLSSWNISKVRNMYEMLSGCSNLVTIYADSNADWNASATLTSHPRMFSGCTKLKGGNGTTYNSSYTNKAYARVDGLDGRPGYFTAKNRTSSAYVLSGLASVLNAIRDLFEPTTAHATDVTGGSRSKGLADAIGDGLCWLWESTLGAKTAYADIVSWTNYTANGSSIKWMIDDAGVLTIAPISGNAGVLKYKGDAFAALNPPPWDSKKADITAVTSPTSSTIRLKGNIYEMFRGYQQLASLDASRWDTSQVTDMSSMFRNCSKLTTLDLSRWDTSQVTSMGYMFFSCDKLTTLNVSGWDTSQVTDMYNMFNYCSQLTTLDMSGWNTSQVTDMRSMFYDCPKLTTLDVSGWDTSRVTDMSQMFRNCSKLTTLDLSRWDTSQVTSMFSMFLDCSQLTTLNVSGWNTSQVMDMEHMFSNCSQLTTLDVSGWNTSQVINMNSAFSNCSQLAAVTLGPNFSFRGNSIESTGLQALLPTPPSSTTTGKWVNHGTGVGALTPEELRDRYDGSSDMVGTWVWDVPSYSIVFDANGGAGSMPTVSPSYLSAYTIPVSSFVWFAHTQTGWDDGNGNVYSLGGTIPANRYSNGDTVTLRAVWQQEDTTVTLQNGEFEFELGPNELALFNGCFPAGTAYTVYEETPSGWVLVSQSDTSGNIPANGTATASFTNRYDEAHTTASIAGTKLFNGYGASAGAFEFVLREGDTEIEHVTNMAGGGIQFSPIAYDESDVGTHTYTIEEIIGSDETVNYDLHRETVTVEVSKSSANLGATVTYDEDGMRFENTTLPGSLQITKQTTGGGDPDQEFEFEVTLKGVADMITLPGPYSSSATHSSSGNDPVTEGGFDIPNVLSGLWNGLVNLILPTEAYGADNTVWWGYENGTLYLSGSQTPHCTSSTRFNDLYWPYRTSVTTVVIDGSLAPTSTAGWFSGFENLEAFINWSNLDVSNVTNMSRMFNGCSGAAFNPDVSGWNTSNVTDMSAMFSNCSGAAFNPDVSGWNTSNVTNMSSMFYQCNGAAFNPDVSDWDTSSVTNMYNMFCYCRGAVFKPDVSDWNTANVTNMSQTFSYCNDAAFNPDVSDWDTSNVTDMSSMFSHCYGAAFNPDVSGWNTTNVTSMSSMFSHCYGATFNPDVSDWDTSNVTSMSYMFSDCFGATFNPDVSNWNTSSVTSMSSMFSFCYGAAFTNLNVSGWSFSKVSAVSNYLGLAGCSHLMELVVSEDTRLSTDFPTHSAQGGYTDKWCNEGLSLLGQTSNDMITKINSGLGAGRWKWEVKTDSAIVRFDPNGGTLVGSTGIVTQTNTTIPVTIPVVTNGIKRFIEWNTRRDGSGTPYSTGATVTPVLGNEIALYALWADPIPAAYHVTVRQESAHELGTYVITGTETRIGAEGETVTVTPDTIPGFVTPEAQTITFANDDSDDITFTYARIRSTVTLDGNGYVPNDTMEFVSGIRQVLPAPAEITGKRFLAWSENADGTGMSYATGTPVRFDEDATLYAQYINEDDAPERQGLDIVYHVKVKAGQTITIPNIPAGTSYEIREVNIPDGWTQQGTIQGGTGVSQAATVTHATATNRYAASGSFSLQAHKKLEGQNISDGQFSFELIDMANPSQVLQTVTNDGEDTRKTLPDGHTGEPVPNPNYGWAPITFQDIQLTAPGTYTYKIREKTTGTNPTTIYDTHEELVTVTATDNYDGTLTTTVTPDNDGTRFTNRTQGGALKLAKVVQEETDASAGTQFEFDLSLSTADGAPIPDAAYEMRTRTPATPSGVEPQGSTPTSDFPPREGEPAVTYDANGGYFEGGYAKNVVSYAVGPTGVAPSQGSYADPLPPASDKAFGGWFSTESCEAGTEFLPSSLTADQTGTKAYAKWLDSPQESATPLQVTGGHATIPVHGGEVVTIPGLPAGTRYALVERSSLGWTQEEAVNAEGEITAAGVSSASVTNRYAASGSFAIEATKAVDGIELENGAFSFVVTDEDGAFVARATNDADGHVTFPNLTIDPSWAGRTLTFHVAEEAGSLPGVRYDPHVEDVLVTFSDDGHGVLSAAVEYDGDGCSFLNVRMIGLPTTGLGGMTPLWAGLSFALVALAGLALMRSWRHRRGDGDGELEGGGRTCEERELMLRQRDWHVPTKRVSPSSDARFNRNRRH